MLSLDIGPKTGQFKNSNHLYQCGYDDLYEKVYSEQLVANDERTILISSQHLHSTPSQLFLTSHQTSSHSWPVKKRHFSNLSLQSNTSNRSNVDHSVYTFGVP